MIEQEQTVVGVTCTGCGTTEDVAGLSVIGLLHFVQHHIVTCS